MGLSSGPRTRRPGLRSAQARTDERNPGTRRLGAHGLRLPGAGLGQCRDPGALRNRRAEEALPAASARWGDLLLLFDDRAARGRRPDPVHDARRARRRRVGDQRREVVQLERALRQLPDRDGGDRPERFPLRGHVDVDRAQRDAGREHRAQRGRRHGAGRRSQPRLYPLRERTCPGGSRTRCAGLGLRDRADTAGWGAQSTTPCGPLRSCDAPST